MTSRWRPRPVRARRKASKSFLTCLPSTETFPFWLRSAPVRLRQRGRHTSPVLFRLPNHPHELIASTCSIYTNEDRKRSARGGDLTVRNYGVCGVQNRAAFNPGKASRERSFPENLSGNRGRGSIPGIE